MSEKRGNRSYQLNLQYRYPGMFVLNIREGNKGRWKRLDISRHMAGILFLFTFTPEVYRDEIWQYLYKLSEDDPKEKNMRVTVSRVITSMIKNELIREVKIDSDRIYHQTMKGRAVWLFIADQLAKDGTLPDTPDKADNLGFGVKRPVWTTETILQNIDEATQARAGQHSDQAREVEEALKTMIAYIRSVTVTGSIDLDQVWAKVKASLRPHKSEGSEGKPFFEDIELEDIEGEE